MIENISIGLMGFETKSPNKGCEALSYSFVDFLNDEFKEYTVNVYVWDTELGILPSVYPKLNFFYVNPRLKDIKMKWIRTICKCDFIFDITMGDSFSDIYSKKSCSRRIFRKSIVEKINRHYILMPQTYGPFLDNSIRKKAVHIVNNADVVMARDVMSIEYLKTCGVKTDIKQYIDIAFMLPYDSSKFKVDKSKINLGINVSGLLWKGGFESDNQFGLNINYKLYIKEIIKYYYSKTTYKIHLIPHVIDESNNAHDDDCYVIKELKNMFPETILAPFFDDPISAKSYISNMDCFIGSRMHSTIAALSTGVPVIPVSYSRKFEGLFETLNYFYLINGISYNTEEAINKTIEYIDNYKEINATIEYINPFIEKKIEDLKEELRNVLKGTKYK